MTKKAAILVAGGKGSRMGGAIAKQYLPVAGLPLLMHTIAVFYRVVPSIDLILVLPESDFPYWDELCAEYKFTLPHRVVSGGNSRFQSVRNGLDALIPENQLVAIHDGVRPFVAESVISESFEVAEKNGSAIAVIALKDSIRKIEDNGRSSFEERQNFRLVQTPQTFQVKKIKKAFTVTEQQQFTDDATVYENQGWQVTLIDGNIDNIKITTPEDMDYAEFLALKKLTDR